MKPLEKNIGCYCNIKGLTLLTCSIGEDVVFQNGKPLDFQIVNIEKGFYVVRLLGEYSKTWIVKPSNCININN